MTSHRTLAKSAWIVIGIIGAVIILYAILVVPFMHTMVSIPRHHLLHGGMAVGAGLLAMALAAALPSPDHERTWWSIPAVLAPVAALFLMWPSMYVYLMAHPLLHLLDHLGIALCTLLAVFAAQAYVRGLGWLMLVVVVAMDVAAAGGFGVSPGLQDVTNTASMKAMSYRTPAQHHPAMDVQSPEVPRPMVTSSQTQSLSVLSRGFFMAAGSSVVSPALMRVSGLTPSTAISASPSSMIHMTG